MIGPFRRRGSSARALPRLLTRLPIQTYQVAGIAIPSQHNDSLCPFFASDELKPGGSVAPTHRIRRHPKPERQPPDECVHTDRFRLSRRLAKNWPQRNAAVVDKRNVSIYPQPHTAGHSSSPIEDTEPPPWRTPAPLGFFDHTARHSDQSLEEPPLDVFPLHRGQKPPIARSRARQLLLHNVKSLKEP